jgi:muconate cycloisomerase
MNTQVAHSVEADRSSEIISIECFPLRLPLRKPLVMSTYRLDDGPVLYVRIRARCGAEGWGEAAASPIMAGETLSGMVSCVRELIEPHVVGRSVFDRTAIAYKLKSAFYGNGGAVAAVDMALLDLAGRIKDVPASDLLGGAVRRSITPLWLIGGSGRADADVAEARALYEQGFRSFKLKVGVKR